MRTIKTTLAFFSLSIFALSCSKDDSPSEKKPSAEASFENTIPVQITDASLGLVGTPPFTTLSNIPQTTIATIEIPTNGTISNLKKLVLEMNIQHNRPSDLNFTLIAPDGTESLFVKRVGSSNFPYLSNRKLRFSATFTDVLPNDSSIEAGNYKESQGLGAFATPILLPIFSTLQDKSITGIWKLRVTDSQNLVTGKIESWKLIFEAGALNQ